jgi:hypothetical protein
MRDNPRRTKAMAPRRAGRSHAPDITDRGDVWPGVAGRAAGPARQPATGPALAHPRLTPNQPGGRRQTGWETR